MISLVAEASLFHYTSDVTPLRIMNVTSQHEYLVQNIFEKLINDRSNLRLKILRRNLLSASVERAKPRSTRRLGSISCCSPLVQFLVSNKAMW